MDALIANTLEFFEWLISLPRQGYTNLTRNAVHMWDDMTTVNYIRMIAIVGGYLFLRPYLQKWGERQQAKQHEKMLSGKAEDRKSKGKKARVSPNALRDGKGKGNGNGKNVSFADEGSDSASDVGGKEEWGKREKKKQKKGEESEGIDIMEHLVDYEEGKDGW